MFQSTFVHRILTGLILSGAYYFLFHSGCQWSAFLGNEPKERELLVVGILSAQNNSLQRQAIRSTWGTLLRNKPAKMVFIIGTRTCPVPPTDRTTLYTCEDWRPLIPKDRSNVLYNVEALLVSNKSCSTSPFVGYTFTVKQNLTVVNLSILSDLLNPDNKHARVKLYNSFTGEVVASATFGYDPGISPGSLLSKAIRPIRLDSSFEGEIKVNSKLNNYSCSMVLSDPSPIHVFEVLDAKGNYADSSTAKNSHIVNGGFGFMIEEIDYWAHHNSQRTFRNLLWEEHESLLGNELIVEQNVHKDLLLIDVVDVYASLSLKTLAFLRWASTLKYEFVLKTDDDVFLDIDTILDQLGSSSGWDWWSCFKVGWPAPNAGKWRDRLSPSKVYPPFPSGSGYVFRTDSLRIVFISE
uniref:Hexosyltransferase n=2 Tax=Lygus hesperus TaxID=30085 RepID=A0A146KPX9_LYGHE